MPEKKKWSLRDSAVVQFGGNVLFVFLLILLFYISSPVAVTDAESSSDIAPDGINLLQNCFLF